MKSRYLSLIASPSVIEDLRTSLHGEDISLSAPIALESPADVLDSPIGADEIRQILELTTVALGAGTASITFVDKLLTTLKKYRGEKVQIQDPATGKKLADITADTPKDEATVVVDR